MPGHTRRGARAPVALRLLLAGGLSVLVCASHAAEEPSHAGCSALAGLDLDDAWPRKPVYVSGDPAHAGAYACR